MNSKFLAGAAGIGAMLATCVLVGSAAAQTVTQPSVTTTPVTSSFSSGNGQTLGTLTFTGGNTNATVTSIPVTITPSNGATIGNLSNCGIYNSAGTVLTGSTGTLQSVSNTFTLSAPYGIGASSMTALTVRCDVASNTPSGAMFSILAGTPVYGSSAMTVNLDTAPSVPTGSSDVALATLVLSGPSLGMGGVNTITSLPITITGSAGASNTDLANCRIRSPQSPGTTLTGTTNLALGAPSTFTFATPFPLISGSSVVFSFACDVQAVTPVGSSFAISVDPTGVVATDANGARVSASGLSGTGPEGLPASLAGTVLVTGSSGTGTGTATGGTSTGTSTGSPGVPNTGAGGFAAETLFALALAAIAALTSGFYLRRSLR